MHCNGPRLKNEGHSEYFSVSRAGSLLGVPNSLKPLPALCFFSRCWGIVLFILLFFCPQCQPVNKSIFVCLCHLSLSFFLVARGAFLKISSRAGQAHSLAGFGLEVALSGQPMCVTAALVKPQVHFLMF